jgi:hypothetical protein
VGGTVDKKGENVGNEPLASSSIVVYFVIDVADCECLDGNGQRMVVGPFEVDATLAVYSVNDKLLMLKHV